MITGAPQGSGLNIPGGQDPVATYDPASQQVRAMTPAAQAALAATIPKGTDPRSIQQSAFDNSILAARTDPNGPQAQQAAQLGIEHPGAFGQLIGATGRRGFKRPRKPGRF